MKFSKKKTVFCTKNSGITFFQKKKLKRQKDLQTKNLFVPKFSKARAILWEKFQTDSIYEFSLVLEIPGEML